MLLRSDEHGTLAIGQLSHSWLSGQLARAWGNERFPGPQPREEIVLGAEQHDIGWAMFDLRPRLSAQTGLPCSFLETTVAEHLEVWETAADRLLAQSHWAALVASLHGCSLSELRIATAEEPDRPPLQRHIDAERARQLRLRDQLGAGEEATRTVQRQMWAWDGLSLALCNGWGPFTSKAVPSADGPAEIELRPAGAGAHTVTPWPFSASRVTVRCEGRRLAPPYDNEAALQRALAAAAPVTLEFVLHP